MRQKLDRLWMDYRRGLIGYREYLDSCRYMAIKQAQGLEALKGRF